MNDTTVRCATCSRTKQVNYSECIRRGWPRCCGATMRLEGSPDRKVVEGAIADAMKPLATVLDAVKRLEKRR